MIIGKLPTGVLVQIVQVKDKVAFSAERGWVCITHNVALSERMKREFKWIPASTRFECVREFAFSSYQQN